MASRPIRRICSKKIPFTTLLLLKCACRRVNNYFQKKNPKKFPKILKFPKKNPLKSQKIPNPVRPSNTCHKMLRSINMITVSRNL